MRNLFSPSYGFLLILMACSPNQGSPSALDKDYPPEGEALQADNQVKPVFKFLSPTTHPELSGRRTSSQLESLEVLPNQQSAKLLRARLEHIRTQTGVAQTLTPPDPTFINTSEIPAAYAEYYSGQPVEVQVGENIRGTLSNSSNLDSEVQYLNPLSTSTATAQITTEIPTLIENRYHSEAKVSSINQDTTLLSNSSLETTDSTISAAIDPINSYSLSVMDNADSENNLVTQSTTMAEAALSSKVKPVCLQIIFEFCEEDLQEGLNSRANTDLQTIKNPHSGDFRLFLPPGFRVEKLN